MKVRRPQSRREQRPRAADVANVRKEPVQRFDINSEISLRDLHIIIAELKEADLLYITDSQFFTICYLAILMPEEFKWLDFDESTYHDMKNKIDRELSAGLNEGSWGMRQIESMGRHPRSEAQVRHKYLTYYSQLVLSFPEFQDKPIIGANPAGPGFSADTFEQVEADMKTAREKSRWGEYLERALNLAILYPERRDELELDDAVFISIRDWLNSRTQVVPRKFFEWAEKLAMLFPERRHEMNIDDEKLDQIRKMNDNNRKWNEWDKLLHGVQTLSIFTADEVVISEEGLRMIHNQPLERTPELPPRNLAIY